MSAWTELATWITPQDVITPTSLPTSTGTSTAVSTGTGGGAGGADNVGALPDWLLTDLVVIVVAIVAAMFVLSWWSLSAPRSTLRNVLGLNAIRRRAREDNSKLITPELISTLATSARSGKRTTRTTLAVGGFSVLFVVVLGVFGLSGAGVRDLRSQVVASLTTLVATIAGFYFGAQTAAGSSSGSGSGTAATTAAPQIRPVKGGPQFTAGKAGHWAPSLSGSPTPTVQLADGSAPLPVGLTLDAATGAIYGTPTSAGTTQVALVANNGLPPAATLDVTITVAPAAAADDAAAGVGAGGAGDAAGDGAEPAGPADGVVAPG
ncbi:Ig domain-containing protein [Dermatophilaceae bacterium Soc4.6]